MNWKGEKGESASGRTLQRGVVCWSSGGSLPRPHVFLRDRGAGLKAKSITITNYSEQRRWRRAGSAVTMGGKRTFTISRRESCGVTPAEKPPGNKENLVVNRASGAACFASAKGRGSRILGCKAFDKSVSTRGWGGEG